MKGNDPVLRGILFVFILLLGFISNSRAADNSLCFGCHQDADLARVDEAGKKISLYVSEARFKSSVHGDLSCSDCHTRVKDDAHSAGGQKVRERVNCGP